MSNQLATLVSVIIPTYNSGTFLAAAINSVLDQSYQPVEIIVIDDGSTDDSAAIAQQCGPTIQLVKQPNAGPAAARNHGVALAQGEWLAFLDADDWWHPQKLEKQMMRFAQQPALGYVLCHMYTHVEADTVWPIALNQAQYQNEPPCFLPSALVVRRAIFQQVGAFDQRYRYSDDADWLLRAKDANIPLAVVPEPLVYKRIHHANLSHAPAMTRETLRAFHASAQRQRILHQKRMQNAA